MDPFCDDLEKTAYDQRPQVSMIPFGSSNFDESVISLTELPILTLIERTGMWKFKSSSVLLFTHVLIAFGGGVKLQPMLIWKYEDASGIISGCDSRG